MNKLFITGGTGYLGSYIVHSLYNQYDVYILHRTCSKFDRLNSILNKLKFINLDSCNLTEEFKSKSPEIVIHSATSYDKDNNDLTTILNSNFILPIMLIENMSFLNKGRFINIDTCIDKKTNYYSLSKFQFKEWMHKFSDKVNCTNIILEHFYGPNLGNSNFISFIVNELMKQNNDIELTSGIQKRDFIYIDDVISAFKYILVKEEAGFNEYEISTGHLISIKELVEKLKVLTKSNSRLLFGAKEYRRNELMESFLNNYKIKSLGWNPKISLDEGLSILINQKSIINT